MKNILKANDHKRKYINKILNGISSKYHDVIPLTDIDAVLRAVDLKLIDEDGSDWSGFLCGENFHACFEIANESGRVDNARMFLSWYRFNTGCYEIVTYLT